jgi:hypothetical protein
MKRFAMAFILVAAAACSGTSKPASTTTETPGTGSGSGSAAIYGKKLVLSWGISPDNGKADVFLQTTDETGRQVSHPLGNFMGECRVIKPADVMKAVSGVSCLYGGDGTELHATVVGDNIIVLKMPVMGGLEPDPMEREEVLRFKAPPGAGVEAAPTP